MILQNDGWLSGAQHAPSPHYDARPAATDIDLLVVHGISLPPGVFGGEAIVKLFCGELDCASHPAYAGLKNLRVSAHFLLRRDAQLIQFVACRQRAWHAGESRWRGRSQCNDFSIGIELEGADDINYTAAQYAALAALIKTLAAQYSLAVAGHEHIAPGRKTDPGAAFAWRTLFDKIGDGCDGRDLSI